MRQDRERPSTGRGVVDRAPKGDLKLLAAWHDWLSAVEAEMAADDQREAERRHVRVLAIQKIIVETPAEGLAGIGLKLALATFLDGFDSGADGEPALSAYRDTARMLDRDFLAEAEAVIERSRDRNGSLNGRTPPRVPKRQAKRVNA
jgi:hypothetical protein